MRMPEIGEKAQTLVSDPIAQQVLLNLGPLLRRMDLSPEAVRAITLRVWPSGRFALEAETKAGPPALFEGALVAGRLQGARAGASSMQGGTAYEFWVAQPEAGALERMLVRAAGSLGPGPVQGTFLQAGWKEPAYRTEVPYAIQEPASISGGVASEWTLTYPLRADGGPQEEGTEHRASIALDGAVQVDGAESRGWEALLAQAKPLPVPEGMNVEGGRVNVDAAHAKPPEQKADIIAFWREPVTALVWRESGQLEILCDKSDTFSPHLPLADQTALQLREWFARSRGPDAPAPVIGYLTDDRAANQAIYAEVDAHLPEFERYFRLRFKDAKLDQYLRDKEEYQAGRTPDLDGFSLAINGHISRYEQAVAAGREPPGDLVLVGDGGNQYRRFVYDPQASDGKIWSWRFDAERFAQDRRRVEEFHRRHPQARIHFLYREHEEKSQDTHPLDAPSDRVQIAELAALTGGTAGPMGGGFSPARMFPMRPAAVLVPKYGIAHLDIQPVRVSPFLSGEAGSRTLASPGFWDTTLPSESLGKPVDLLELMLTSKTGYPQLDDDRYNRFSETAPTVGGGLFYFLGTRDLVGREVPFSHLIEKYKGLNAVAPWSGAIVRQIQRAGLDPLEQQRAVQDYLALHQTDILKDVWPSGPDEFGAFGPTGEALAGLAGYLTRMQYYYNLKNSFPAGSPLQKFCEQQYEQTTQAGLGYYTRPLMRTKAMTGLYESMVWNALQSLGFMEGGAGAYFKGYFHAGETGSRNPLVRGFEGRHPSMTLWAGLAYDPFIRPAGEQGFYIQLKDFLGAYAGMTLNKPLMRNPRCPVDFRLELAAGVIAPLGKEAGLELSSVGLLGEGYVGRWPLTRASPVGALRASLLGAYLPESDAYEFNWRVSVDGLPTAAVLYLKDHRYGLFGPDANTRKRVYEANPALENWVPPNTIAASLHVPVWNKLQDVTGAMVEGLFSGQAVSSGFRVKELGLKASLTPFEGCPTLELKAGGEGFVGISSFLATAGLRQRFGAFETSLEYQFKRYPLKTLNHLAFEMKFEL